VLQNDEGDDEEMFPEESANDGFMVPDGQLSEDEGLSSVQQDIDTLCADHEGASPHHVLTPPISYTPATTLPPPLLPHVGRLSVKRQQLQRIAQLQPSPPPSPARLPTTLGPIGFFVHRRLSVLMLLLPLCPPLPSTPPVLF